MLISYRGLSKFMYKRWRWPPSRPTYIWSEFLFLLRLRLSLLLTLYFLILPFLNSFPALVNIHWEKHTAMVLPLIRPRHFQCIYIYIRTHIAVPQNTSKTLITGPKVFFSLVPVSLSFLFSDKKLPRLYGFGYNASELIKHFILHIFYTVIFVWVFIFDTS